MDADDNPDMIHPDSASLEAELKKRRTTRIVQAVPLLVTGIDALGRPFQERTSTLIINCHGCRYQSKHYVLKNMWVNLEIPNAEQDRPPRTVRGKVVWIQRPRTVRQLFQVALELEVPGNIWGIAFPPADWFPFPELALASGELPGSAGESVFVVPPDQTPEPETSWNGLHVVTPVTPTDASLQLARQVARLVAEARQQMQSLAREAAGEVIAAEAKPALAEVQGKIEAARHEIEDAVASSIERATRESASQLRLAQESAATALRDELPRWLASQMEGLAREMAKHMVEASAVQIAQQQSQTGEQVSSLLADAGRQLDELRRKAEESAARLASQVQQFENELASRLETSHQRWEQLTQGQMTETSSAHREALLVAAADVRQQITATLAAAEAAWSRRIQIDLESASGRLQQSSESAIAAAAQRAAEEIEARRKDSLSQLDAELASRGDAFQSSLSAAGGTLDSLAQLRAALSAERVRAEAALGEAGRAAAFLEPLSSQLEDMRLGTVQEIDSQFRSLLEVQTAELRRRADASIKEFSAQIQKTAEAAGQARTAQFEEKFASTLAPNLTRAEELAGVLAHATAEFDSAIEAQRARLRDAAEESISASLGRFHESFSTVEKEFQERTQETLSRSLADLDSRAAQVQHATIDSLYKSAEWYEKKVQVQLQTVLEKGLEQAGNSLREKAGELSAAFASEIDRTSRSFVDHAQGQMEEVVKDTFERARTLFSEVAETTTAAFTDEIQRNARQELEGFEHAARKALEGSRGESEAQVEAFRGRVAAESQRAEEQFRSGMTAALESGVVETHKQIEASLGPLLESWRSMTEAHQAHLREFYGRLSDESVDQYRQRLENVSNSWMVAAVTSLDHQTRDLLANTTRSAEEKLRETCAQLFAQAGDALRARLQETSSSFFVRSATSPEK